jgi:hypothetical protein
VFELKLKTDISQADSSVASKSLKVELKIKKEETAFERILRAMYNMPYRIDSMEALDAMTR